MTAETLLAIVEITVLMTSVAVIVGIIARKLRMPYTVGLVVVGSLVFVAVSWMRQLRIEELSPIFSYLLDMLDTVLELETETIREAILVLLVPPLIFEAAFHLRFNKLVRDLPTILLFAIPGVLITTLLVGWVVARGTGLGVQNYRCLRRSHCSHRPRCCNRVIPFSGSTQTAVGIIRRRKFAQ